MNRTEDSRDCGKEKRHGITTSLAVALIAAWTFIGCIGIAQMDWQLAPSDIEFVINNPKVGQIVKLPEKEVLGRRIPVNETKSVVLGGYCSTCSLRSKPPSAIAQQSRSLFRAHDAAIILCYQASSAEVQEIAKHSERRIYVVADA